MRNVSDILARERNAWAAYRGYCVARMRVTIPGKNDYHIAIFQGDDRSRALFTVWRQFRIELDGVSQPHHKQNRMHAGRFSIR